MQDEGPDMDDSLLLQQYREVMYKSLGRPSFEESMCREHKLFMLQTALLSRRESTPLNYFEDRTLKPWTSISLGRTPLS